MKTLYPKWDDQTFSITLPTEDFTEDAVFELTVMDYDEGDDNDDDLMGGKKLEG